MSQCRRGIQPARYARRRRWRTSVAWPMGLADGTCPATSIAPCIIPACANALSPMNQRPGPRHTHRAWCPSARVPCTPRCLSRHQARRRMRLRPGACRTCTRCCPGRYREHNRRPRDPRRAGTCTRRSLDSRQHRLLRQVAWSRRSARASKQHKSSHYGLDSWRVPFGGAQMAAERIPEASSGPMATVSETIQICAWNVTSPLAPRSRA